MTTAALVRTPSIVNRTRWHRWVLLVLVVCTLAVGPAARATAQHSDDATQASSPADTSFTYRGQLLRLGEPVSDLVDFEFTLWDAAEDILNRQIRIGITDEELAKLVVALREEDKLCVEEKDPTLAEPRIICSLGLRVT